MKIRYSIHIITPKQTRIINIFKFLIQFFLLSYTYLSIIIIIILQMPGE